MERVLDIPWLDAYRDYTQNIEAPPSFHLWTGISTIASALQRKCWVRFPRHLLTVYPNLYVVLTAPPGICRKGTIINVSLDLLRALKGPYILANDITREKMLREMRDNPFTHLVDGRELIHHSVSCVAEELSTLVGVKDTHMLIALTSLWNSEKLYKYSTKGQGEDEIPNVFLNILAGTTPDWLSSSLPKEAIGGGFTSRIVFVCEVDPGQRKSLTDRALPKLDEELESDLLDDLGHIYQMKGEMLWLPETAKLYDEWYYSQDITNPSIQDARFHDYLFGRKPVMVWKVAMCLAASYNSVDEDTEQGVITGEILAEAIKILDMLERNMSHAFGGYGQSELADVTYKVQRIIAKHPGITSKGILRKLIFDIKDRMQLMVILNNLLHIKAITKGGEDEEGETMYYTG